jgi:hypothetical protein
MFWKIKIPDAFPEGSCHEPKWALILFVGPKWQFDANGSDTYNGLIQCLGGLQFGPKLLLNE